MKNKRLIYIISLVIIFTLALCGCGKSKESIGGKESKQADLIKLPGGDWGEPTPFLCYSRGPGVSKMEMIFDSLLEKDEKGIIPWLAESYEKSSDGKEFVFKIRENVKWQDGKPMTAEDVKFSFEYFSKYSPVSNSLIVDNKNIIQSIEVLEFNKVKIVVSQNNATTLESLGAVRIIPKHIWENVSDPTKFTGKDAWVGCGPYILKEYDKTQGSYRFVANTEYWGPKPQVSEVQFIPVSDETLAFDKGEIDLFTPSPDVLSKYQNNLEYKVSEAPAFWGYRIIPNMAKREELKDKELRQAITYAIDKNELIDKVARGAAVEASPAYLPLNHIWYNNDIKKYAFDLNKAKELSKGKNYSFEILCANSSEELRICELIKINMDKIGINITVKSVDMKSRDAAIKSGNYELVLTGHGGWGSDADSLRKMYAANKAETQMANAGGIPGYYNNEIDKLAKAQLTETDANKRKEIVMDLQKLIAEEVPMFPIYNTVDKNVYKPSTYSGWMYKYDHHATTQCKLSYLTREK